MLLQLCIRLNTVENVAAIDPLAATMNDDRNMVESEPTCRVPIRSPRSVTNASPPLQWYSSATHVAAFALPPLLQRQLFPLCEDDNTNENLFSNGIVNAPSPSLSNDERASRRATTTHPADSTSSYKTYNGTDKEDTSTTTANTTRCQPQKQLGCFGNSIHRWIQRHFSSGTSTFISVPP